MKPQIQLSPKESLALEALLTIQSQKAKHTITLSYLMDKWSRFVMDVEEGEYRLTIDDYTNSLSVRNIIQKVLEACPENISLREWINESDTRFEKATEIVKEPLLLPLGKEKLGWWWFRIPIHPGSALKKWFQLTKQK